MYYMKNELKMVPNLELSDCRVGKCARASRCGGRRARAGASASGSDEREEGGGSYCQSHLSCLARLLLPDLFPPAIFLSQVT